jgi:hypothetical protein
MRSHTLPEEHCLGLRSNHSLQATATRLRCAAWAVRTGVRSWCGSRRLVRVAVPEFNRYAKTHVSFAWTGGGSGQSIELKRLALPHFPVLHVPVIKPAGELMTGI